MGLFLSNTALSLYLFFFSPCNRFVKQEQESILMVQRSTDIVYITTAAVVYGGLDRPSEDAAILKHIVSQTL